MAFLLRSRLLMPPSKASIRSCGSLDRANSPRSQGQSKDWTSVTRLNLHWTERSFAGGWQPVGKQTLGHSGICTALNRGPASTEIASNSHKPTLQDSLDEKRVYTTLL